MIYCDCAYTDRVSSATREAVLQGLSQAGVSFEAVPDLCQLAAEQDPRLQAWSKGPALTVIACFPRTIQWLFHLGAAPLPEEMPVTCMNMRTQSAEEILAAVSRSHSDETPVKPPIIQKEGDWIPWFPVLDYERCQTCKLCLNFCLFGVYALSEQGQVRVTQPANCKTNCPACARVCPHQAIIFPKHAEAPINGDAVPDTAPETHAQGLETLLSGSIHDALRARAKKGRRFASDPVGSDSPSMSILETLHQQLDIPREVLESLSPQDLARIRQRSQPQETDKDTVHE